MKDREKHREIYEAYFGLIPDGFEIHHNDRNHFNNHPDNLVAVSSEMHGWIHREKRVNPWMHTINWREFGKELRSALQ